MSQVMPSADAFDHGALVYGTNVIGYLGARPNATSYQHGQMGDGYGVGSCSAGAQDTAQTSGNPSGWMRRQYMPTDIRVRMASRKHAVVGVPLAEHLVRHGVLARIIGGTLAQNGTSGVAYEGLTCYALLATYEAALPGIRFRIVRFDAGVQTVLATKDDAANAIGDFTTDVELRLDVTTVGGDVLLQAYAANVSGDAGFAQVVHQGGGSGIPHIATGGSTFVGTPLIPVRGASAGIASHGAYSGSGTAVALLEATDSSVSKITAAGRAGFLIDCERAVTSPAVASLVSVASFFEVADLAVPTSPAVVWRDEFKRAASSLSGSFADKFTTPHRKLASDYSCDQASGEAINILRRATGEEAALAPVIADFGQAIRLNGTDEYLELQNAHKTFPAAALPSATEITIAVWAVLDTAVVGDNNPLYQGRTTGTSGAGFSFGVLNTLGNYFLHVVLNGGGGFSGDVQGATFAPTSYTGQRWCYVFTYKANANPTTGEGRVRFYAGRLGVAALLSEHVVAATIRPTWDNGATHYLGHDTAGPPGFFDGTLDEASVFNRELTAAQVGQVCTETADPADFPSLGLAAGWHFDVYTDIGGVSGKRWAPYYSAVAGGVSADTDDWFREISTVTVATPGLIPVYPGSAFTAIAQRPPSSSTDQHRAVRFKPVSETSIGGVLVRVSPTATQGLFNGYRLDAAPGNPARIAIYRVIGGVPTKMAEQDPDAGTAVITAGSYAAVSLQVRQRADGGPFGPVQLTARLSAVIVPMVSNEPGVTLVDLDGNVIDTSSDRIVSGPAEGFHGFVDGLDNAFDDWSEGALTGPTAADAAPSYAIPNEADGAFGDLADVLGVDWSLDVRSPAPRVVTRMESGHQIRVALDDYERRMIPMRKSGATDAEIAALRAFWDGHQGGVIPFAWDLSPFAAEQQAGYWRFVDDSLQDSIDPHTGARVTAFEVEEVRAPS